jgi:Flp pilus assembly protein CpaB
LNTKLRGIIIAILGLVLLGTGVVAVYLLLIRVNSPVAVISAQPTPVPVAKTSVVVLTHDVFLGDLLGAEDLTMLEVPAEMAPRDSLSKVEDAANKFVKTDMIQGEMVLAHNLADPTNVNHDVAYILSKDHFLMAFPAQDLMSQLSIVQRGDIVDIFATLDIAAINTSPKPTGPQPTPTAAAVQGPPSTTSEKPAPQNVTLDAYQGVKITALVADIITNKDQQQNPPTVDNPPDRSQIIVKAYLLALPHQDALLLKYLIDSGAKFDFVIRPPTSTDTLELTPITSDYLTELYGLGIIP